MSDDTTKRLLAPFIQAAPNPMFLSSFFQSPPQNFHASEEVEIDVQRDGEDVAIVITDLATGARLNSNDLYTNKSIKPPIFKERSALQAFSLMSRNPGELPFETTQSLGFQARAINRTAVLTGKMQRKIKRSTELQAAQVLQSGKVTLVNEAGVQLYTVDYAPKVTHHTAVSTSWNADGTGGDRLQDLNDLADVIRTDGLTDPNCLIFGKVAWQRFLRPQAVKDSMTRFGLGLGELAPKRGRGATFQGWIWIGNYRFEMWTYNGFYKHPQTGVPTPFVADDKVIMLSSDARLDATYGAIPRFVDTEARALQFMPQRVSDSAIGLDMTLVAWLTPDGETLVVQVGARPLMVPTEIDSFGSLDVVIP